METTPIKGTELECICLQDEPLLQVGFHYTSVNPTYIINCLGLSRDSVIYRGAVLVLGVKWDPSLTVDVNFSLAPKSSS